MSLIWRSALVTGLVTPVAAAPLHAQTQIAFQHALPVKSHTGVGASTFKDAFERLTNNRYRVVTQRHDNEREMMESVQIGNIMPEVRIVDVPFLIRDSAHARSVLESEAGGQ